MDAEILKKLIELTVEQEKVPQDIGGGCTVMKRTGRVIIDEEILDELLRFVK